MAASVNKVILVGNLGAEPEVRRTQDGRPIVRMRIATSESWRDRNSGERRDKTEWHTVVIFNEGLCKVAEQFLHKGSKVYLEGQLQTREWEDQQGQKRQSTEVVLQGFNSQLTMLDAAPGATRERDDAHADRRQTYGDVKGRGSDPVQTSSGRIDRTMGGGYASHASDDDIPFAPEWR